MCLRKRVEITTFSGFKKGKRDVLSDYETAVKRKIPIVSAITKVDIPDGLSVLLVLHEGTYNKTAKHFLLSEFELREFGVQIDSTCHR
jgi:hypothetical protein